MKTILQQLSLFLIIFLWGGPKGQAQIVNIEDKRVMLDDSTNWYGQVRLGFNLVENGSSVLNLNGAISIEYDKDKHWFLSLSNFNFIQVNNEDFVNEGFQHFRYNYKASRWLIYEAFTQAQYNEKLRLRLRWLAGGGLRFPILQKENQEIFLGITYMYEYNEERDPDLEFRDHRMSTYASFGLQPFKNASLSNTTYYQPVINDLDDLRLSSQTTLAINLTSRLLFSSTFSITHDTRVPEDVENTIYSLRNGIRWNF